MIGVVVQQICHISANSDRCLFHDGECLLELALSLRVFALLRMNNGNSLQALSYCRMILAGQSLVDGEYAIVEVHGGGVIAFRFVNRSEVEHSLNQTGVMRSKALFQRVQRLSIQLGGLIRFTELRINSSKSAR